MPYVMPRDGFTIHDPDRRDILPAGKFRPVPDGRYWRRLARDNDVVLRDQVPDELVEGYEPPVADKPAPKSAVNPGSDA